MSGREEDPDVRLERLIHLKLLGRARLTSARTLECLRTLREHYPNALPPGLVERLEGGECRQSPRLPCSHGVAVRFLDDLEQEVPARVTDWSSGGRALCVNRPIEPGQAILVREDPEAGWLLVEVKHSRPEGDHWLAGCLLLDTTVLDQKPS